MMKHVEINELVNAIPVMSRKAKLLHWAKLVRAQVNPLRLFHGLEYASHSILEEVKVEVAMGTSLGLAASDPTFRAMGLTEKSSLLDALRFFGVTQDEAHAFACDCMGAISNDEQARRIEGLADKSL